MNKVFIVDDGSNPARTRFTQTKLFFDAQNQGINWATDCEVVTTVDQVTSPGVIISSGDFITSTFRRHHAVVNDIIDARQHDDIIHFDKAYSFDINKQPPWPQGSKQRYILDNLYKVVLQSRRLIYLDNTESKLPALIPQGVKHFFGLASGLKSAAIVRDIRPMKLDSVTIFDINDRQLSWQESLHKQRCLPDHLSVDPPACGTWNPTKEIREFWPRWHEINVSFQKLDLMSGPRFPPHSLIWISNVFHYEPSMFALGWEVCQTAKKVLLERNSSSIIIER